MSRRASFTPAKTRGPITEPALGLAALTNTSYLKDQGYTNKPEMSLLERNSNTSETVKAGITTKKANTYGGSQREAQRYTLPMAAFLRVPSTLRQVEDGRLSQRAACPRARSKPQASRSDPDARSSCRHVTRSEEGPQGGVRTTGRRWVHWENDAVTQAGGVKGSGYLVF